MSDAPRSPAIELTRAQIERIVAPLCDGAAVDTIQRCEEGLVNTVYRVALCNGRGVFGLRAVRRTVYALSDECALLRRLAGSFPVPEPMLVSAVAGPGSVTCVVYRWIDGISLNAYRRRASAGQFTGIAASLGALLGRVARGPGEALRELSIATEIGRAHACLQKSRVRERLGAAASSQLRGLLVHYEPHLLQSDGQKGLVHGDFGGRNVLVHEIAGCWTVSGLLDWESVARGSRLWDPGSLFQYRHRYDDQFVARFARGYAEAGTALPDDWCFLARVLDATRLIEVFDNESESPAVLRECGELVAALLAEAQDRGPL